MDTGTLYADEYAEVETYPGYVYLRETYVRGEKLKIKFKKSEVEININVFRRKKSTILG